MAEGTMREEPADMMPNLYHSSTSTASFQRGADEVEHEAD